MAIEIYRGTTEWMYRIAADDDRCIQRRKLTKGARWEDFKTCDTAQAAREIILVMTEELPR